MSAYKLIGTLAYALLVCGLALRRTRPRAHAALMVSGMITDVCLVLVLELQRGAIATATSGDVGWAQMTHIAASVLAVLLYAPVAWLGSKRLNATASARESTWHLRLGVAAFLLRTIGEAFMFSMPAQGFV